MAASDFLRSSLSLADPSPPKGMEKRLIIWREVTRSNGAYILSSFRRVGLQVVDCRKLEPTKFVVVLMSRRCSCWELVLSSRAVCCCGQLHSICPDFQLRHVSQNNEQRKDDTPEPSSSETWRSRGSVTHQRIPRACAQAYAIVAHTQAADTVLMTNQRSHLFASSNVPDLAKMLVLKRLCDCQSWNELSHLALEIIVACKQKTTRHRGSDGSDAAKNRFGLDGIERISGKTSLEGQKKKKATQRTTTGLPKNLRHRRLVPCLLEYQTAYR